MFTVGKFCINVFQMPESVRSGPISAGEKNIESANKTNEALRAKKWGQELLAKTFTKTATKRSAEEAIQKEFANLNTQGTNIKKGTPYGVIIEEYRLFMGDIFDEKGNYKQTAAQGIQALSKAIGIDGRTSTEDLAKIADKTKIFIGKYPLSTFSTKIYDMVVGHPIKSGTWIFFNEYKEIKSIVDKLGKEIDPGYKAIIDTMENMRGTQVFSDYTGKIDEIRQKSLGNQAQVEEFRKNLKLFIDMSASQKKPLDMRDFEKKFSITRTLTPEEILETQKYGEGLLSTLFTTKNSDFLITAKKTLDNNRGNMNDLVYERKMVVINSIQVLSKDTRFTDSWGTAISDTLSFNKKTTEEAFKKFAALAINESVKTGVVTSIKVKDGEYTIEDMKSLRVKIQTDIGTVNGELLKKYIMSIGTEYSRLDKELGSPAVIAIGIYLKNKGNTTKLSNLPDAMKTYFIKTGEKEITEQQKLATDKKLNEFSGRFENIFPSLKNNENLDDTMKGLLKQGKVGDFYNALALVPNMTNGKIKGIMELVEKDMNNFKAENQKNTLEASKGFTGKSVKDIVEELTIKDKGDEEYIKKIKDKGLSIGALSTDERDWLLIRVKSKSSKLYEYLKGLKDNELAGGTQAGAKQAHNIAKKGNPNSPAEKLIPNQQVTIDKAQRVGIAGASQGMNTLLTTKNLQATDVLGQEQVNAQQIRDKKEVATAVASLDATPGLTQEDKRSVMRASFDTQASDKEIDRWIDTQVFISKYVEEKNFVDIVERNAAYMNLGQSKSIGELYDGGNKMDLSSMSSENGSMRLSETNILGNNSFQGMSELMNCKVEVGDSGLFTRTIRSPEGVIVAENVPLDNIPSTIQQLGRFYALGLGSIAPYMQQVSASINKVRPDKITGLNGDFSIAEDTKFLKILSIMLYGEAAMPADPNIPNLIALFNKPERERNPKYLLKECGIIQDTGSINSTRLDSQLQDASKQVT